MLSNSDAYCFNLLKKAVTTTFLERNHTTRKIEEWKGEEIVAFQEDLFSKVKAKVSEKWFYTYFKNTPEKLPRIDMLNLLSNYIGYKSWEAFKIKHPFKEKIKKRNKAFYFVPIVILVVLTSIYVSKTKKQTFHFCFINEITNNPITNTPLSLQVLLKNESPLHFKTDSLGCFEYTTLESQIKLVVQSPYYKTDTIVRSIHSNSNKTVKVASDDYALILDYYVNKNKKDWEKHKEKLNNLISNNAKIYRLFGNNLGIEIYSKEDFIRLTTIPTSTLKRIKILDKVIEEDKIVTLKFIVK